MTEEGFLAHVSEMAGLLRQRLAGLQDQFPDVIEEVRGEGLMLGLKLKAPNGAFVEAARSTKLLIVPAGDNVVRLLPPLIIETEHVDQAVTALETACGVMQNASVAAK